MVSTFSEILHLTPQYVSECLHLCLSASGAFKEAPQKCKSVTAVTKRHKYTCALDAHCIHKLLEHTNAHALTLKQIKHKPADTNFQHLFFICIKTVLIPGHQ